MTKYLLTSALVFISLLGLAQDKHFSQFYAAPLTVNPAMTGLFDGRYRGTVNYRSQWNSILNQPFRTIGAAGEGSFSVAERGQYPDKFGLGVMFFSDDVGTQAFSSDQLGLSGAFHKALDFKGRSMLSVGYQLNIVQKSVNFNSLTFDDEFNGLNGYTLGTGEELPQNNVTYADMAAGLFWTISPKRSRVYYLGAAFHHINTPDASFYEDDQVQPDPVFARYSLQGGARLRFNSKFDLEPRFIVMLQGPHIEANLGASVRLSLDDYSTQNLYLGSWIRPVSDVNNSFGVDAVVLMAAYRYDNIQMGFSYDVNTSPLSNATGYNGGFELSLSVIGMYNNDNILCPKF